ncbi:VOC family protein [Chryseobacterium bernardetii]|uniref:VOC family protein n=1 Tax=Chryseobacterium bernardetii TaxID=1241978 RepID=UPI003018713C
MKTNLGRVIILVKDYDEAYRFYQQNFFCEKLFDMKVSESQRFLHIRFCSDDHSGIWFLKAETAEQENMVGRQTAGQPTLLIYTDDCNGLYTHVQNNGVKIIEPIVISDSSNYFHCADLYGNRITVVQLK